MARNARAFAGRFTDSRLLFKPPLKLLIKFARRQPLGAMGGIALVALVVVAIFAPYIAPQDPFKSHLDYKYAEPGATTLEGETFLLGTDQLGRDMLSRLIHGSRISLRVALISVAIGVTLGGLVGMVSGYLGGKVDLLVQRVVDAFMAFPALILALGIMAVLGPSVNNVILTLTVIFIPGASRVVRAETLKVKETMYIDAARSLGCTDQRIIFRHVLPNCMAPYIVFATANLGFAIIIEAALSFLGVGSPPDVPSWGGTLSVGGSQYLEVSPWLVVFPSLAIVVAVFGLNLFGDALRDTLDPRLRGAEEG